MTPISVHVWFVPLQQNKKLVPLANGTRTEILTDTLVRSITTNIGIEC